MAPKIEGFLPLDPGAPVWHAQPEQQHAAKSKAGGDDPEEDDDDDDDPDEDDDDDDDPDEDKDEDELRAELKKVREALGKANGQSKKRRIAGRKRERELLAQLDEARKPKGKPKRKDDDDDDDPVDIDEVKRATRAEADAEHLKQRKADKAELALARAGVDSSKLSKAVRLLDLDDLDLDDDGTLDGIDDAIDELKKEWGELFAKPKTKRRSVAGDADKDGEGERTRSKNKTASQKQADQLLGRGRS